MKDIAEIAAVFLLIFVFTGAFITSFSCCGPSEVKPEPETPGCRQGDLQNKRNFLYKCFLTPGKHNNQYDCEDKADILYPCDIKPPTQPPDAGDW
jgi:hypothetical protein